MKNKLIPDQPNLNMFAFVHTYTYLQKRNSFISTKKKKTNC